MGDGRLYGIPAVLYEIRRIPRKNLIEGGLLKTKFSTRGRNVNNRKRLGKKKRAEAVEIYWGKRKIPDRICLKTTHLSCTANIAHVSLKGKTSSSHPSLSTESSIFLLSLLGCSLFNFRADWFFLNNSIQRVSFTYLCAHIILNLSPVHIGT